MADELGIKHQTKNSNYVSEIKFITENSVRTIRLDENGNDMSPYDEVSCEIQCLYEDLCELISEKREREKLTPEQLKSIKKRNKDRDMLMGLRNEYLCWVNSCLIIRFNDKFSISKIQTQERAPEREFGINEIDELLDLIYT
jgi:uncharacterized protein YnzC (UPF0291/DUF896 family)